MSIRKPAQAKPLSPSQIAPEVLRTIEAERGLRQRLWDALVAECPTDAGRFSIVGRKAMMGIVDAFQLVLETPDAELALIKGTQLGWTTIFAYLALHMVFDRRRSVIYYLPDDEWAADIDDTRIRPLLLAIPRWAGAGAEAEGGTEDRRHRGLWQSGNKFLYVRGLKTKKRARSSSADLWISDETDGTDETNLKLARDRVGASQHRNRFYFSQPMFDGLGIDARWKRGSQGRWIVTCTACDERQWTADHWPENHRQSADGAAREDHWLACHKCGHDLDVEAGEWVHAQPDQYAAGKLSFRLTALDVPGARPVKALWADWQDAADDEEALKLFYASNLTRALPGTAQPITDTALAAARRPYAPSLSHANPLGPVTAGLDFGKRCWLVVVAWVNRPGTLGHIIWAEGFPVTQAREIVAQRREALRWDQLVVDSAPEFSTALAVASDAPGNTCLHRFNPAPRGGQKKGQQPVTYETFDGQRYRLVTSDRDTDLDAVTRMFALPNPVMMLPRTTAEPWATVAEHLKNLRREPTPDGSLGGYLHNVENHCGLALNYCRVGARAIGALRVRPASRAAPVDFDDGLPPGRTAQLNAAFGLGPELDDDGDSYSGGRFGRAF
jgi:hypothetical protein